MSGKRRVHRAAFKAQVALAALKGDRTVNERAGHYGVHPTLIHGWNQDGAALAQKKLPFSWEPRRPLADHGHPALGVRRRCELLGLSRSSLDDEPTGEAAEDPRLTRLTDGPYTARPFYGSRRMTARLATPPTGAPGWRPGWPTRGREPRPRWRSRGGCRTRWS